MATRLSVFNDALGMLGQPLFNTDLDDNEDGDALRGHWDRIVRLAHEKTDWHHAKTIVQLSKLATVPPSGWDNYFQLPAGMVRLLLVSETGMPDDELLDYDIHTGKLASNTDTVYATVVSDSGLTNVGRWTESFAHYVATELALAAAPRINASAVEPITKERKKALSDATGLDATMAPPKRRPHGSWSRAARGVRGPLDREQRD